VDYFEVQLMLCTRSPYTRHQPTGHIFVGRSIRKKFVNVLLRKSTVNDDGMMGTWCWRAGFEDQRMRPSGDQTIRIDGIQVGTRCDFVGMSQEERTTWAHVSGRKGLWVVLRVPGGQKRMIAATTKSLRS